MTGSSGDSQGVGGSYMQLSAKIIENHKNYHLQPQKNIRFNYEQLYKTYFELY